MPNVSEILGYERRPGLPGGGSPRMEEAYLAWKAEFLVVLADELTLAWWHEAADRPPVVSGYELDMYMFMELCGADLADDVGHQIYRYRLRYLGIWFETRRDEVLRAARGFGDKLTA